MDEVTEYLTVTLKSAGIFKDKGSKFIAKACHVENLEDVKKEMDSIRKEYYDARHHCYAYRFNPEDEVSRSSDDGEPSGTAGKPIMNQLLSYGITNTLLVVVRYFGGTKLGVSGLIKAYKSAAKDALEKNKIIKKYISSEVILSFEYPLMNSVMRIIKEEKLRILKQDFDSNCKIYIELKKNQEKITRKKIDKIRGVIIK